MVHAGDLGNVSRDIKAVYLEFQLPIFENFDLNLAARHDNYSGFGGTTQIATVTTPNGEVKVRTSSATRINACN